MSSVENFKSVIQRIRDILRSEAITGMDSMRHICIYILARNITPSIAEKYNIPLKFTWDQLFDKTISMSRALEMFYSPDEECLLNYLDDLFETKKFAFDVKSDLKHREIMEAIHSIDIMNAQCEIDIIGWIYEQHLKTGSSSASRDLGQYFTDRSICSYMVNLVNPKVNKRGVPESVCDPTMGTGGLIAMYMKHMEKKHIDWSKHYNQIYGVDKDTRVTGLARLNMFIESGGVVFQNLITDDSLNNGLSLPGYDIILANMPFGVKGLKHADCCERVKELGIRGTKSEPLFLQLMMTSLNEFGRCAVVVPDGVLVNDSVLHNDTRKYLLDNFELKRVIKMEGGFFMNTGIKPSILFFENSGCSTDRIEFLTVTKNKNGEIVEEPIITISRDQLDKKHTLDYRKFVQKEENRVSTSFEMVRLGDIVDCEKFTKFNSSDMDNNGDVPFYTGSWSSPVGTHSKESYSSTTPYYVFIKDGGGDHNSDKVGMGMLFRVNGSCAVGSHNMILTLKKYDEITYKYVYYYTQTNIKSIRDMAKYSINLGSISKESIMNYEIPLPPIEIQREIVDTIERLFVDGVSIDRIRMLTNHRAMDILLMDPTGSELLQFINIEKIVMNAKNTIPLLRQQMADIMRTVRKDTYKDEISKYITINSGEYITKTSEKEGQYPVYGGGGKSYYISRYNREPTCVINKDGISENCVHIVRERFFLNHHGWTLDITNDKLFDQFLFWQLYLNQADIYKLATGSCQKGINREDFNSLTIYVPPIELQRNIVKRLESIEAQIRSLEEMRTSAEENARFILDSYFQESSVSDDSSTSTSEETAAQPKTEETETIVKKRIKRRIVVKDI